MKCCRRCGEEKPLEDFPERSTKQARDGRYSYCRPCDRELSRERSRRWRERNPEKAKAKSKEASARFRAENPDYVREWYEANAEKQRAKAREAMRQYRKQNPEAAREAVRRWRKNNPEAAKAFDRENTHRRRALMKGTSNELATFMAELVKHPCSYCGATEDITVDHIIPLSRGGKHEAENIAPACLPCNCSKNNRLLSEWSGRRAA